MFDNLKNLANLPAMMAKAREMQDKMKAMQDELAQKQVIADAGAGAVTAIVNGRLELVALRIDKEKLVDPADLEMIEDLTVSAVNAAHAKATEMMREEMSKLAGDMGLPPGMLPNS
ncbi:MAG: YbaB/EbfC family nucleoid-associated protein [Anaerolineae bacterium]|nr:YbaB/EbfC family nucleoid-associated protein [Phycisphaerae bacterium]